MPDENQTTLALMKPGRSGVVVAVMGKRGMAHRLGALGIIPGKKITKISSLFMRGPVTILVDRAQIAIGYGMANRILVRLV
jgi:ferrous iron transport protein A